MGGFSLFFFSFFLFFFSFLFFSFFSFSFFLPFFFLFSFPFFLFLNWYLHVHGIILAVGVVERRCGRWVWCYRTAGA